MNIGKHLEFIRTPDIVAIAGYTVGNHLAVLVVAHLRALERLDHAVFLGHAANPVV